MTEAAKKINVLVFPCGSEIGLEIHKSVAYSTHFKLYGGSSVDDHGKFVYDNYIGDMPQVTDTDFVPAIDRIVAEHGIRFIMPAHDSVVLRHAQAAAAGELDCQVITSEARTCEVARSKRLTYDVLQDVVPIPRVYDSLEQVPDADFPVFLKPDVGQGSKGTHRADTKEDARFYIQKDPSLMILEFLPGDEYTMDCFTDKNGRLQFVEGRVRNRISNGISVSAKLAEDEKFEQHAEAINDALKFRGAWFFQMKRNTAGELVLMEIAPRIAGTMGYARMRGVNLPLLSLFDAVDYPVDITANNYGLVVDRALMNRAQLDITYKHVYIDFDDLVILDGRVNPYVMAFVFQCRNKGIRLHLITKHADDLAETLRSYRLDNIFDDILWIRDGTSKYTYITEKDAIFIDDSFAERKEVFMRSQIPVFDSHMIEGLMDKF